MHWAMPEAVRASSSFNLVSEGESIFASRFSCWQSNKLISFAEETDSLLAYAVDISPVCGAELLGMKTEIRRAATTDISLLTTLKSGKISVYLNTKKIFKVERKTHLSRIERVGIDRSNSTSSCVHFCNSPKHPEILEDAAGLISPEASFSTPSTLPLL